MEDSQSLNGRVLALQDVHLTRGARSVLSGITCEVTRGELVALMGPSGSGKTTMLRVIAALEPFHSGKVEIEELALSAGGWSDRAMVRRFRRKVGLVFQFHHLFEHLSAVTNVWLAPVHAYGVPYRDALQKARRLLASLGVEHCAEALPRQLSGGEAQRVAIARALAVDPPLLLMDEPTASLDSSRRTELQSLLKGLLTERRTIVVATHDQEFAHGCATRIMQIDEGVVYEKN
jgi:ABC-type polar amino acid transport system ATPase subunit